MEKTLTADEQFETKMAILADVLVKKKAALLAVLAISENQENLYATPAGSERHEALMQMGKEKQVHIDSVLACDDFFQKVFDSISDVFEDKGRNYAEQVRGLQEAITELLELDIKIRATEEKVKLAVQSAWEQKPPETTEAPKAVQHQLLQAYKDNNRNRNR